MVINGHGGNHDAVQLAARLAAEEGRRLLTWSPPLPPGGDHHAGWVETSVMLALHPELVRLDLAERGNVDPIGELSAAMRRAGLAAVTTNGVLGDPRGAAVERGERVLALWRSELWSRLLRWLPGTSRTP